MAVNKLDPKIIFASEAPAQDVPAVFTNKTVGWGESRKNGGRPTIKQSNALQQETDLKILWLNENSVTPYDPEIDYPTNAVTLKDGSFKIFNGSIWSLFLDKSSVGLGNVDNTSDANKPVSSATQSALASKANKSYVDTALPHNNLIDRNVDSAHQASAVKDESGKNQQEINSKNSIDLSILNSDVDYVEKSKIATPQGQMYFTNKNPTFDPLALGYIGWKQGDKVSEFSINKNVDNLMLIKYGYFAPVEAPSIMVQASNFRNASGAVIDPATTIAGWGTTNPYFTDAQIGFKFDLTFTGVGLISRHNGNAQGGMFKVTIPDVIERDITTYAVPNGTKTIEIVNGLPFSTYTATFEYIGHDPNNPSSAQRGYFKYDEAGTVSQSSGYVISGDELIGSTTKELVITNIIEFAINAKPAGTALTKDWIPSHSQVLGATVTNNRIVLIDGINYGSDFSTIPLNSVKKCSQILIMQNYTAYCTNDTTKDFPLWDGVLVHRFDVDGLTVTNLTNPLLRDVEFGNGYMGMVSSQGTVTPNFITDNGTNGVITGTTEGWYPKFSKIVLFYNKTTKKSVGVKVLSIVESSNLNRAYAPTEPTRLTDRTDGFGKVYWNLFNNGQTLPAGTNLSSSHNIFMSANDYSL